MRLLKTLVIVMGVVLVVGFGALIYIVVGRIATPRQEPAPVAVAVPPAAPEAAAGSDAPAETLAAGAALPPHFTPSFGAQSLVLPAGARVSDFSAGGDRLVLRLILPDHSQQLAVVDLNTGALIGTLKIENGDGDTPSVLTPLPGVEVPPRNRQEGRR